MALIGSTTVSGLDQVERCFLPKPSSVEVDSRQDGKQTHPSTDCCSSCSGLVYSGGCVF